MEGCVNVTLEPGATFTSARGFSYTASILFTLVKITPQWNSTLSRQDRTALDQKNPYTPVVNNIFWDLHNSSHRQIAEFNDCFIIHSKYF